jgi:hypothetical protein
MAGWKSRKEEDQLVHGKDATLAESPIQKIRRFHATMAEQQWPGTNISADAQSASPGEYICNNSHMRPILRISGL